VYEPAPLINDEHKSVALPEKLSNVSLVSNKQRIDPIKLKPAHLPKDLGINSTTRDTIKPEVTAPVSTAISASTTVSVNMTIALNHQEKTMPVLNQNTDHYDDELDELLNM